MMMRASTATTAPAKTPILLFSSSGPSICLNNQCIIYCIYVGIWFLILLKDRIYAWTFLFRLNNHFVFFKYTCNNTNIISHIFDVFLNGLCMQCRSKLSLLWRYAFYHGRSATSNHRSFTWGHVPVMTSHVPLPVEHSDLQVSLQL